MVENVTIEMVYKEIKDIKEMLEELTERAILNVLPEEEPTEDELRAIRQREKEIDRGECVTLEEAIKLLKEK